MENNNQPRLYFAYGANLNRDSMSWRCPGARPLRATVLPGWSLEFCQHATVTPDPDGAVPGALWEITEQCEQSLDSFEGFPVYYHKHWVDLDGEKVMLYVMTDRDPAMPTAGYLATIAQGYQDWGLDPEPLWQAVAYTEERLNDMYWSATRVTGSTLDLDRELSGLDLEHELRDLRDLESAHSRR